MVQPPEGSAVHGAGAVAVGVPSALATGRDYRPLQMGRGASDTWGLRAARRGGRQGAA